MDETTHAFAVETTAEIEVLKTALTVLFSELLRRLAADDREMVMRAIVETAREVPPGAPFPTPEATRFFEAVAEAMPRHAERFAEDVRRAIE